MAKNPRRSTTGVARIERRVAPELIRAQAADLRGVEIGEQRAAELAVEIARFNDAVTQECHRLDFNDEPARFTALLMQAAGSAGKAR